jgi:hypothetical protein
MDVEASTAQASRQPGCRCFVLLFTSTAPNPFDLRRQPTLQIATKKFKRRRRACLSRRINSFMDERDKKNQQSGQTGQYGQNQQGGQPGQQHSGQPHQGGQHGEPKKGNQGQNENENEQDDQNRDRQRRSA